MSFLNRLEIGSNAFELIEFSLDRLLPDGSIKRGLYGVNVAKVREVVRMPEINPLSSSIQGVSGVFELRGVPIPAINLAIALGDKESPVSKNHQIIVTEFSLKRAGFIVNSTHRIRRIAWDKVLPPAADKMTCINGMTLVEDNQFLFILDLEKIISMLEMEIDIKQSSKLNQSPDAVRNYQKSRKKVRGIKLLLVDDSQFILNSTCNFLEEQGFSVITATNGKEAKIIIEKTKTEPSHTVDVVITDVEMPQMDGLSFTKWIKEHDEFSNIPIILHTSLSGKANEEAASSVGADGYIVKNDFRNLMKKLEDMLDNKPK